jgi:putative oxidoreductase
MRALIENGYQLLTPVANALQSPLLLFVRLYWGWQFIQTGWGKVNNIEKVTNYFTELGIPLPAMSAHFVAGVELMGGILLVFGLASRLTGLVLTVNMLVAYVTADREALLSIISDPDKFTGATPYTFFFASLIVLIFGAGKLSADGWLAARVRRHEHGRTDRGESRGTNEIRGLELRSS